MLEDAGDAELFVDLPEALAELNANLHIKGAERLVEQQDFRLVRERCVAAGLPRVEMESDFRDLPIRRYPAVRSASPRAAAAPGFVETEMVHTIPEKLLSHLLEHTPLGRMGKPEEVANAYVFLASDEADFINGIVLSVDGGLVI